MQATIANPAEVRVVLHDVPWDTFQRLLATGEDNPGTRFAYDQGELEIMVVSRTHENRNRMLAALAEIVAEETGCDLFEAGSATLQRPDMEKGIEPDSSYYLRNLADIEEKAELDLTRDPPPDLVIVVDITRSSMNKFRILASIGVEEIWRDDGERVKMYVRSGGGYEEAASSRVLPPLSPVQATAFLDARKHQRRNAWVRDVRTWVRAQAR